ncbi:MAG: TlpA family protein disulfide reductase [Actinomycetota bacterium]|nr:TlpA family protein disulfide reductase [Actinomycetota bacterium]
MRRFAAILAGLALAAVLVVGLTQAGGEGPKQRAFDLADARRELAGAPAPLASLHEQSAELLGGGRSAFRKRLAGLEGYPVVVNKWASWCAPCRTEFPIFQSQAVVQGKKVAFIGLNSGDSRDPARRFLRGAPLPFPSYLDPDEDIAKTIKAPANYPVTVFFDRRGKLAYVHQGGYRRESDLVDDMARYLS